MNTNKTALYEGLTDIELKIIENPSWSRPAVRELLFKLLANRMELKLKVDELEVRNANQRETIISRTTTEPTDTDYRDRLDRMVHGIIAGSVTNQYFNFTDAVKDAMTILAAIDEEVAKKGGTQ